MGAAISLRGLVKTFNGHRAVDGISLEVSEGIVFGLIGPNGAGKTTTIRMILDIIRPDEGEVRILGRRMDGAVKDSVGYLPEERGLYRKMKVLEMLEFQGSIKGISIAAARKQASGWLEKLGIGDWAGKKVEELSKGMQQKVQLIAALLGNPRLLILDEPFSGMDPVNQNLFKDTLLEFNRSGITVVFSTHQMDTAERLCRDIALIDRGRVVLNGPLAEVKSRFGTNSVLLEFEGDGTYLRSLPGVERVDDYGQYSEIRLAQGGDPQVVLQAAAGRLRVRRFEIVAPTLHNIFIEKVGRRDADA
jgi:ABC-2 type transport system ATP-binding protein